MKSFLLRSVMALCAVFTLFSCGKEIELEGTAWESSSKFTVKEEGLTLPIELQSNIHFSDASHGVMSMIVKVDMGFFGSYSDAMPLSFTYTFDGEEKGTAVITDDDTTYSVTFKYSADNKAITMKMPGEMEFLSNANMVFKESSFKPQGSIVGSKWTGTDTEIEFTTDRTGVMRYKEAELDDEGEETGNKVDRTATFTYVYNGYAGSMECNVEMPADSEDEEQYTAAFAMKSNTSMRFFSLMGGEVAMTRQ